MSNDYLDQVNNALKSQILSSFDFAFKIDWENPHHKKINKYLTSLTMYFGVKMTSHISTAGSYNAYRFNERTNIDQKVDKFRNLFKNESPTFSEEFCNGCYIFTF